MKIEDLSPNPYVPPRQVRDREPTAMYPYDTQGKPIGFHCLPRGHHALCTIKDCACPCHDGKEKKTYEVEVDPEPWDVMI